MIVIMKTQLIINPLSKIDKEEKKVRLLSIKNNKVLISIYSGIYMLPGGKVDGNETDEQALIREINEETGNILTKDEFEEFITIDNYQENYPSRNFATPINKRIITKYYVIDDLLTPKNSHLSALEKEGDFELLQLDIDDLINRLNNCKSPKQKIFAEELLIVLKEYLKENKLIDLHTHTIYSDGEYTPDEVIEKAKSCNIKTVAITDHDTVLGLKNIDYNAHQEIDIIPGVELTVKRPFGRMHILGYFIDYNNPELNDLLNEIHQNSINNLKNIADYLAYIGIILKEQDLEKIFHKIGNVGRPDIAKLLVKERYVSSIQEAFDKYLIEAFNKTRQKNNGYSYAEVLNIIKKAGGISSLAHPTSLELDHIDFEILLQDMIKKGLDAIEVFHPHINDEERKFYMEMVNKYNLLYSAGSDFHGEHVKPDIALGTGTNNLYQKDASILRYKP